MAVNNVARSPDRHPLTDMDEKELDSVLNVLLKGVALCLASDASSYVTGVLLPVDGSYSVTQDS